MGDPNKFASIYQYFILLVSFWAMILLEFVLLLVTHQGKSNAKASDHGTRWIISIGYWICIWLSFFMVSQVIPNPIRQLVLPKWVAWIGIALIWIGLLVRIVAVATLKKAFTLSVQTTEKQELITNGIYHIVRNPAYTGSIVSLIGFAVSFRSLIAIILVIVISMVCYDKRIKVEEGALEEQFKNKYIDYEKRTYRLFPYIW